MPSEPVHPDGGPVDNPLVPHRPIFTPRFVPHGDDFLHITPHATYIISRAQLHAMVGRGGQLLFPPPFID
jgi:hypothetical protein